MILSRVLRVLFAIVSLIALLAPTKASAQGFSPGTPDDFEGGSFYNWTQGGPSPSGNLTLVAGGPAGPSDNYLQVISSGKSGAGAKLIVFNQTQWTGSTSGVTQISMDLLSNTTNSSSSLPMRLAFMDTSGYEYSSSVPYSLPNDGNWHHATFSIAAQNLTSLNGGPTTFTSLDVSEMRIVGSTFPAYQGDPIAATIGIDNITSGSAATAPEPTGILLVAGVVAALGRPIIRLRRRLP